MKELTKKQREVYSFIVDYMEEYCIPPSIREIAVGIGSASSSTASYHLNRLAEVGYISIEKGKPRSLRILVQEWQKNRIPLLGNVAAGAPILANEYVEDYLCFDAGGREDEYFALRVRGDSMINAGILEGDCVAVHRQETARSGEIVVAIFEDEATVKRLKIRDREVWLMPENEEYAPLDGTYARIQGKVVGVIRQYD